MKKKPSSTKANQSRSPKKPIRKTEPARGAQAPGGVARAGGRAATGIVELILRDHGPLKALIETLKNPEIKRANKAAVCEKFVAALTAHAKAEEQTLYVQMKEVPAMRVESFEGDTEHALAEQLMMEINATPDDDEWTAKVKVLAESVAHHIDEEESEILKDAQKQFDAETRIALGEEYSRIKSEIDRLNVPVRKKTGAIAEIRLN